jgi:hypothetical protein
MRPANDEPQKRRSRGGSRRTPRARGRPAFDFAGFILAQLGRVPRESDAVAYSGWCFKVIDMDGRRIDKVLVRRVTAHE